MLAMLQMKMLHDKDCSITKGMAAGVFRSIEQTNKTTCYREYLRVSSFRTRIDHGYISNNLVHPSSIKRFVPFPI